MLQLCRLIKFGLYFCFHNLVLKSIKSITTIVKNKTYSNKYLGIEPTKP